jgi:hypothetical protein
MKTEMKQDGILVRAALTGDNLVLVLEPMDEGFSLELASQVSEVRIACVDPKAIRMPDIQRNISEPVWITWDGQAVTFESEHAPTFTFPSGSVASVERDYDTQDLRAKFAYLGKCFKAREETHGKMIAGLTKTKETIAKFVESHRHSWMLKREFFGPKNPGKAKEFAARLEVLDEIDRIMKED